MDVRARNSHQMILSQLGLRTDEVDPNASPFLQLVKEGKFIDTTLFIEQILNSSQQVAVFYGQTHGGKTTNLAMLYTFLSKSILNAKDIFSRFSIANKSYFSEHLQQYDVIYLNFNGFKPKTYKELYDGISERMKVLFKSFSYMVSVVNDMQYNVDRIINDNPINKTRLEFSLQDLMNLIRPYHQATHSASSDLWILIDDYDAVIEQIVIEEREAAKRLLKNIYSKLKQSITYRSVVMGRAETRELLPNNCSYQPVGDQNCIFFVNAIDNNNASIHKAIKPIFNEAYSQYFYELVKEKKFIDKTSFIETILSQNLPKGMLICEPSKCGKSVNLAMLYTFLSRTTPQAIQAIFSEYAIARNQEVISHLGMYDVIYLNFANRLVKTDDEFITMLSGEIKRAFSEYHFLLDYLDSFVKEDFKAIMDADKIDRHCLEDSLSILVNAIVTFNQVQSYEHKRPIILIDGYDAALEGEAADNKPTRSWLLRQMLNQFDGGPYLKSAIVMSRTNPPLKPNYFTVREVEVHYKRQFLSLSEREQIAQPKTAYRLVR